MQNEELLFKVKQAKTAIWAWKSLLHSVNQGSARVELLEKLDESSVLLVQDWAIKYLLRKYRESQIDWFGKRGIPCDVTVATRREGEKIKNKIINNKNTAVTYYIDRKEFHFFISSFSLLLGCHWCSVIRINVFAPVPS